MDRGWIVVGDPTSGGGHVLTGSPLADVGGKPVARVGDHAFCERHKGAFPIVDGDNTLLIDGKPVALHGSSLSCGCKVLSAQQQSAFVSQAAADGRSRSVAGGPRLQPTNLAGTAGDVGPAGLSPLDYPGSGRDANAPSVPDWSLAKGVIIDSHDALMEAGAYLDYDSELDAARAWREHVLPIANSEQYGVEVGALIAKMPNGKYRLGAPWSSGEHATVDDLVAKGPRPAGAERVTAAIHTHPRAGGWPGGGDRAFAMNQFPDARGVGGYGGEGDVQAGDLVYGYSERVSVYIADSAGLNHWDVERYIEIQAADRMLAVPLREAYRSGL